ncbi:hypothetical protein A9G09_12025 [Gilliamella sp. wkB292]|uniref:hypothetical protein n=1 Tax=Gilliamella sp. wkB292 TaxID=3120262 RepID=UPI00080E2C07|nr:hypothetical protein [Gilliamella apicola]OCG10833.1 hypothetical protein A9G09_12025 [Gilliamella apicola]
MTLKKYKIETVLNLDGEKSFVMKESQFGHYVTSECAENLLTKINGLRLTITLHERNALRIRNKLTELRNSTREFGYYKYKSITLSEVIHSLTECLSNSIKNGKNNELNQYLLNFLKSVIDNCLELTTDISIEEIQKLIKTYYQLKRETNNDD